jgi:hypothetical protein
VLKSGSGASTHPARRTANSSRARLAGGSIDPAETGWQDAGDSVVMGADPEGNVFQLVAPNP